MQVDSSDKQKNKNARVPYKPGQDPTGTRPDPVGDPGWYPACFSSRIVPVSLAYPGRWADYGQITDRLRA